MRAITKSAVAAALRQAVTEKTQVSSPNLTEQVHHEAAHSISFLLLKMKVNSKVVKLLKMCRNQLNNNKKKTDQQNKIWSNLFGFCLYRTSEILLNRSLTLIITNYKINKIKLAVNM